MTQSIRVKPKSRSRLIKYTAEDRVVDVYVYVSLIALCVITLYPFINTLAISLNDAIDSVRGGIYLWPRMFTWANYSNILTSNTVNMTYALRNSAGRALIGGSLSTFSCMLLAYTLTRREFVLRKAYNFLLVASMYVSGGLIPGYLTVKAYGLINNYMVYILPGLVGAYNVLVMRTFIGGIPNELVESAKLDGAHEYRILFGIIFPLSMPVIATIMLFVSVAQWNAWFDTMLYCAAKKELTTLQFELQKLLASATVSADQDMIASTESMKVGGTVTPNSIRAAMTILVTLPILFVYPFLQRYFVKGLTIGAVKG